MRNRVKFKTGGVIHYGIVKYCLTKETKELKLERKILVEDAIFPKGWTVFERNLVDASDKEYENYVIQNFQIAKEKSDALPTGCVLGKLLRFEVYDGCVYYQIVKINKLTVKLQWRGYSLDRYFEPVLGYEGVMNKERCESYIQQSERLAALFS